MAKSGAKHGKKHIISTAFEHDAVLHTLEALQADGFEVTLLPVHSDGLVVPEEVTAAIRLDTCLLTMRLEPSSPFPRSGGFAVRLVCRSIQMQYRR